jgi:para-aminobenzoate synthetase component 1
MTVEILTTFEHWRGWIPAYNMLPYVVKYPFTDKLPVDWSMAWKEASPYSCLLESGKGGRYTFLGLRPAAVIEGKGDIAQTREAGKPPGLFEGKPLQVLKQWLEPFQAPRLGDLPRFSGGCVGYIGYDAVRSLEKLPERAADDLGLPDYVMMRFDRVWAIDREEEALYCCMYTHLQDNQHLRIEEGGLETLYGQAASEAVEMKCVWDRIASVNTDAAAVRESQRKLEEVSAGREQIDLESIPDMRTAFPKADFIHAVQRIQDYIASGDVFQVNLSVRQDRPLRTDPAQIYEWLRALNPSPYMGLLRMPGLQLVSASPELLVRLDAGIVSTRPIAGTRPRGRNAEEDWRLAAELIGNEKERAEHVMLVDLERNDLGKISKYGTVRVNDFMVIETYSHVMHIVSEIRGELAEGKDAFDVIAATFPGGTITGAPKIRTMEIIEELEPVRRGPYTGSIGWIDYNGNMELNIVIRTLAAVGDTAYVQAGAGIVVDSVPDKEYTEALNKAKALWKAMEYSERHADITAARP